MHSPSAPVRKVPLVVLLGTAAGTEELADRLRHHGAVVYVAHSAQACLRVSVALGPDLIVVDERFPEQLRCLLAAHPSTARARLVRLATMLDARRAVAA